MRGFMKKRFAWKLLLYLAFMTVALILFYYESAEIDNIRIDVIRKLSTSSSERLDYRFPQIEKDQDIEPCSYEINIYVQFILDDSKHDKKHINDIHNMFCSLLKNTGCKTTFYVLANEKGTDVIKEMVTNFEKNYQWFVSPLIVFLDYYKIARSVVNYTKPMKVKILFSLF